MSKKTAVVIDSSIGFSSREAAEHGLFLLPSIISYENKSFKDDGIELTHEQFIKMKQNGVVKTSMCSVGEAEQLFATLSEQYAKIVFIGIADQLSNQYQQIKLREKEFDKLIVIDNYDASYGLRETVIKAKIKLNDGSWTPADLQEYIINKVRSYHVIVSDIMSVKRSGRISNSKALIGILLKIKVLIKFTKDGRLVQEDKCRTFKKAIRICIQKLKKELKTIDGDGIKICIEQYFVDDELIDLAISMIKDEMPKCKMAAPILFPKVIATHTGLKALAFYGQKDQ